MIEWIVEQSRRLYAWYGRVREHTRHPSWRVIRWVVVLVVVSLSVWFMWTRLETGLADVVRSGIRFSVWRIAVSWVCVTVCSALGAAAWALLVRSLGADLGLVRGMHIHSVSNLGKYVPGSIWSYAGKAYLSMEQGVAAGVAVLSIAVEFVILYFTGFAFAVVCLPFSGLVDWPLRFGLWFQGAATLAVPEVAPAAMVIVAPLDKLTVISVSVGLSTDAV